MKNDIEVDPGSFRDPSGFVFRYKGEVFRQINRFYKDNYDLCNKTGLFKKLFKIGLLLPHEEVDFKFELLSEEAYKVIKPEQIPFISYPYEWCNSQLKDAALTTLRIQKEALECGMSLKDASAFNIQFLNGKPLLIDTLSFEPNSEGDPWIAYRQFCQHFLAPLVIGKYKNYGFLQIFKSYIDGIPLNMASNILPTISYLNPSIMMHIHLHAKSQQKSSLKEFDSNKKKLNKYAIHGLIDMLHKTIENIKCDSFETLWSNYYKEYHLYSDDEFEKKKDIVSSYLDDIEPLNLWDMGANTGVFSRIASSKGINTIAMDIDSKCVEMNYILSKEKNDKNILPILMDIANPSPAIGWGNSERKSLQERGPADCLMALALIHHLAISNNIPLESISNYFKEVCKNLIIEFIPKGDPQVKKLLLNKEDIYSNYSQAMFEKAFLKHFDIKNCETITTSGRVMYLMKRKY